MRTTPLVSWCMALRIRDSLSGTLYTSSAGQPRVHHGSLNRRLSSGPQSRATVGYCTLLTSLPGLWVQTLGQRILDSLWKPHWFSLKSRLLLPATIFWITLQKTLHRAKQFLWSCHSDREHPSYACSGTVSLSPLAHSLNALYIGSSTTEPLSLPLTSATQQWSCLHLEPYHSSANW